MRIHTTINIHKVSKGYISISSREDKDQIHKNSTFQQPKTVYEKVTDSSIIVPKTGNKLSTRHN